MLLYGFGFYPYCYILPQLLLITLVETAFFSIFCSNTNLLVYCVIILSETKQQTINDMHLATYIASNWWYQTLQDVISDYIDDMRGYQSLFVSTHAVCSRNMFCVVFLLFFCCFYSKKSKKKWFQREWWIVTVV